MLNEKVSYTINFFKDQGKMITRDEAISIIKHMESLPAYKQYKSEIQPLIIKEVSLEKELESLQSAIDEERTKLLDIEKEISKLNKS
jgi:predicted  nucleic acid-binding Zn-ribbon protein